MFWIVNKKYKSLQLQGLEHWSIFVSLAVLVQKLKTVGTYSHAVYLNFDWLFRHNKTLTAIDPSSVLHISQGKRISEAVSGCSASSHYSDLWR